MRQNQWKKAGLTVLSAIFMGSLSLAAAGTGIPALAATKDVAVTEYDEAALVKFKDNTLEYWEIPGDSSRGIMRIIRTSCRSIITIRRIHGPYKGSDVSAGGGSPRGGG